MYIGKINQLKWLQAIGIEYYLSKSSRKDNKIFVSSNIKNNQSVEPSLYQNKLKNEEKNNMGQSLKDSNNVKTMEDNNSAVKLARTLADSAKTLEDLRNSLMNFNGCGLKKLATNTVFSDGNPRSPIMFIGEAPGSNEDFQGIPFCGESGKLLDNILASINISRKDNAYITNTVFWRPPANRQPTQEEIDICRPFVEKHIALINPKLIVLIGNVAATSLLGKNAGISKIRQEYYLYNNQYLTNPIQTTAIFHPAYLLRQPMQKKTTWYDLLKIQEFIIENLG
ncbi:MAG: uracil-DNA glycosylase [Rickettsia endosymbiont of Bryobia graminum]|nr:uracil-DNA glycosylase [Rickettsia endosymbiont of Bryobia graminum]